MFPSEVVENLPLACKGMDYTRRCTQAVMGHAEMVKQHGSVLHMGLQMLAA